MSKGLWLVRLKYQDNNIGITLDLNYCRVRSKQKRYRDLFILEGDGKEFQYRGSWGNNSVFESDIREVIGPYVKPIEEV